MWHTLAFTKLDTAGATNEQITAVIDQIVTQSPNGNYILQQDMLLRAAYFRDAGATGARVNTPHFRLVSIPNIHPVNRQTGVINLPEIHFYQPSGIRIPRIDELRFEASNDGGGGVRAVGGLWISPLNDILNIPQGDVYKLHGTVTSAGVAASWELKPIVLDEVLPDGIYTVIGLDVVCNGAAGQAEFARLAWTGGAMAGGGPLWRPGVTVQIGQANQNWRNWQNGNWGILGSFVSTSQPNMEVFSATGTALVYQIYMDVIKTG